MSESTDTRSKLAIIKELHALTKGMVARKNDADYLILSVEQRQDLMDEYDLLDNSGGEGESPDDPAEIKRLIQEIIGMDSTISAALEQHKIESKSDLANSNTQQKILGYTNQAMSTSGSYMDYRK